MVDSIPQLIDATLELDQSLKHIEHASVLFSNPNPATRSQGEDVFLNFRQSSEAVDFACFALSRTGDAFVLFQAFQAILDKLPTLSLSQPTQLISSLTVLRDFLLEVILARSRMERTKGIRTAKSSSSSSSSSWSDRRQFSWPKHTQTRAYQTFAAVEKRLIGLQLEEASLHGTNIEGAVKAHAEYISSTLVSVLALPGSWPDDDEMLLRTQSNINVGFGVINALLDEVNTTYARLDSEGNHLGKARSIDFSGLLPMQHRWCKAILQSYVLPHLLRSIVGMLHSTLEGQVQSNEISFLFPLLVSTNARIFGWTFVIEEPFAGIDQSVSVERQTELLRQDETSEDASEEDDKNAGADSISKTGKISFRSIPETHLDLISGDVLAVLYMAYNYAELLEREKPGESGFYVSELRRTLLDVASFRPVLNQEANRQVVANSKRYQLDYIISIIAQAHGNNGGDINTRSHNTVYGKALLFISQLLHSFLTSSDDRQLLFAAVDITTLVKSFSVLTNLVWLFAFEPRAQSDEEEDLVQLGDEAVDNVLSSWRLLLPYSHDDVKDQASQWIKSVISEQVVKAYIKQKLDNAGHIPEEDSLAYSELGQEVVSDAQKYQEQLITLASLARDADLVSCLQYLSQGTHVYLQDLQQFHSRVEPINEEERKQVEGLWEQIHWIILIAGHVIADQSKGEVATVAQQIVESSAEGQVAVIKIIHSINVTLFDIFSQSNAQMQSPRVTETALWFVARWVPVYLLASTTPVLSAHFNGNHGQEMLQHLLSRLQHVVKVWSSDTDVILQVASVMKSFSLSEGVMHILLSLAEFQHTVQVITQNFDQLPTKTHGPLISSIVGCIYTSSTSQSPESFFAFITNAIENRLSSIIHQPNFASSQVSQQAETISRLMNCLDMFEGLASSIQPKSAAAVYSFLSRFFETLVGLVQLYHERSEVVVAIIRIYRTLIGVLDLGFGAPEDMVIGLNTAVSSLLSKIDAKSLLGDSPEMALEEDIPFEGLCLVIEMLSDLMLASDNDAADTRLWFAPLSTDITSDVCFQGFSRVIPLLTDDARSVAKVRRRFAKLTSNLWISYPHRLSGIAVTASSEENHGLFQACVSALVISLGFVESHLLIDCFDAIRHLSMAVEKIFNMTGSSLSPAILNSIIDSMTQILSSVLNGILIEPLANSLLDLHLLAIRSLFQSLANEKMGGMQALQVRMQAYCQTSNLVSRFAGFQNIHIEQKAIEKKRSELSIAVYEIANLSLSNYHQQQASMNSIQGRQEEEIFLKEARKAAWEGRAKIRAG